MTYTHTFTDAAAARRLLSAIAASNGRAYMLTMNDAHHEVRELVAMAPFNQATAAAMCARRHSLECNV